MTASPRPDPLVVCEAAARAGAAVLRDWVGRFAVTSKGPRDLVTEADVAAQQAIRGVLLAAFPDHGFVGEEADAAGGPQAPGSAGHAGTGDRWIVDPLDGTTNYVHGYPAYCVSIALAGAAGLEVGAILDPVRDECFTARRGGGAFLDGRPIRVAGTTALEDAIVAVSFPPQVTAASPAVADLLAVLPRAHSIRRSGSTALNLAYVACGRLQAFWARRIACWDAAAGLLIAREAGATVESFAVRGGDVPLDDPAFIVASTPGLLAELREVLGTPAEPAVPAGRS